jgi:hypothetical protein
MSKFPCITGCLVVISLAVSAFGASAAETGTKTMPSSSINPPPTHPPIFGTYQHRDCYLPSDATCDNRHRVQN